MGQHPSFSSAGPSATYQPETFDTADGTTAGNLLPSVIAKGKGNVELAKETGGNLDTIAAKLTSMLTVLQKQRSETIWTDDTDARFIRVSIGDTLLWTDPLGSVSSGPGTGARPDNDSSSTVSRATFQATAAGTGFSTGDLIDHFVVSDQSGDPIGNFWVNIITGLKIAAPASASITYFSTLAVGASTEAKQESIRALLAAGLTLAAGEAHLGQIGSDGVHITIAPVATAKTYTAGKCIGGLVDLPGFLRVAGRGALMQSATVRTKVANSNQVDLVIFRDVPTITTGLVDNATFSVDPADVSKVAKVISFTAWNSLGTPSMSTVDGIGKYMTLPAGSTAKAIFVARGALTLNDSADLAGSVANVLD